MTIYLPVTRCQRVWGKCKICCTRSLGAMPKSNCKIKTIAAIAIAVLTVVFNSLIKAVKTSQETIKAAIMMINSTGMDASLQKIWGRARGQGEILAGCLFLPSRSRRLLILGLEECDRVSLRTFAKLSISPYS